jgi:tRNA/rRNA methyltransferase
MISVILIQPITSGNVGAIARVMANFNVKKLYLVQPACDHLCKESQDRAKHAKDILKKATVTTLDVIRKEHHVLIATTARLGNQYNLQRIPFTPTQLADHLAQLSPKTDIGIVFGRETDGLTNEELALCDMTVTIPTHSAYKSMNVSHAAAILLSYLFVPEQKFDQKFIPLNEKEKEKAIELIDGILDSWHFPTPHMRETQKILWRKLIGKSFLTRREGYALMGFLKKVKK